MIDETNPIVSEFTGSLHGLSRRGEQLEKTLAQIAATLITKGVQLNVDVDELIEDYQAEVTDLRRTSDKIVQELYQVQELVRISALITSSLEIDDVLEDVMDTVIQLTGAERAYIMLQDPNSHELSIRSARNWDRETLSSKDVIFSRGIVNAAIAQGTPILTTNAQDDDRFQGMASVFSNDLRSIVVIPLSFQGKALGVMYADNRLSKGVFSQQKVPLISAFATQAAIAIANARQFEKVKDDLKEAQREVQRLRIQVDQSKVQEQLGEITESDYFQKLTGMAREMRRRAGKDAEE